MTTTQIISYIDKQMDNYYKLYVMNLYLLVETSNYVNEAAQIHASKLVKDRNQSSFSVRIFHNPIIQSIVLSKTYQDVVKNEKFHLLIDSDIFRKAFQKFSATEHYQSYIQLPEPGIKDDLKVVNKLYESLVHENELIEHAIEDVMSNWHDDKQSILQWVSATLKEVSTKPVQDSIPGKKPLREERQFARQLVEAYDYHEQEYSELIKPKLKNWDEDRIAELDMLLIKLGLTEFLYLPDIPVKVTINEYLEVAKQYSTPQSKDFINGILDSLLKDLTTSKKVSKSGRGALES